MALLLDYHMWTKLYTFHLADKQATLLEARDVITIELCAECYDKSDGRHNYFKCFFGEQASLTSGSTGTMDYCGDVVSGKTDSFVDSWFEFTYGRYFITIDRKNGIIRTYTKPGDVISERQCESWKSDTWFKGANYIKIGQCKLWSFRVYDHDMSTMDANELPESILPYGFPTGYKNIDMNDYVEKLLTAPYNTPSADRGHLEEDGWHMTGQVNDTFGSTTYSVDPQVRKRYVTVDFKIVSGSVKIYYAGASDTFYKLVNHVGTTDVEIPAEDAVNVGIGSYTLTKRACPNNTIGQALEADTEVVVNEARFAVVRCVMNITPQIVHNNALYDDAADTWYPAEGAIRQQLFKTYDIIPCIFSGVVPANKLYPSMNGELKVSEDGKAYVGYVKGTTRVWKQINNS